MKHSRLQFRRFFRVRMVRGNMTNCRQHEWVDCLAAIGPTLATASGDDPDPLSLSITWGF